MSVFITKRSVSRELNNGAMFPEGTQGHMQNLRTRKSNLEKSFGSITVSMLSALQLLVLMPFVECVNQAELTINCQCKRKHNVDLSCRV